MQAPPSLVVFDMDETLGHFVQLGAFWDVLEAAHGRPLSQDHFVETLALYPELVRPGMELTLAQLVGARDRGLISGIVLYTNNQGPTTWAELVAAYFDRIVGTRVFDQIIPAYMAHGRRVCACRTSHAKSPADLQRCTGFPAHTRICFIDDQEHGPMMSDGVYYIRVPPHAATLLPGDMARRYLVANNHRLTRGFERELGMQVLSDRRMEGMPELGSPQSGDVTGWMKAHIGKFVELGRPEVTRRRRHVKRGLTRRRRPGMLWL